MDYVALILLTGIGGHSAWEADMFARLLPLRELAREVA